MFPLTLVGGDPRACNVLSLFYGAHGVGRGIFGFLTLLDANNLRLVCQEMKREVTAFPWNDSTTPVKGKELERWRTSYPNARAAKITGPLRNTDFIFLKGLRARC